MKFNRWALLGSSAALAVVLANASSCAQTPPALRDWDPVTLSNMRPNSVTLIGWTAPDPANSPKPAHSYLLSPANGEAVKIQIDVSKELPPFGKKFAVTGKVSATHTLFVDGHETLEVSVIEKSRLPSQ
jgi:hypothetical protein